MHDWLAWLFEYAEGEVEFRALPNVRGEGKPELLFTRDPATLDRFVTRNDVAGRSVYFGVATRKPGTAPPGRLGTLLALPALWTDLDHLQDKEAVIALLRGCYCPPSGINDSGGGLHVYWRLVEPEDVSDATSNDHPLVETMRQLRRVFAGDPAVCDLARIMRLPGTTNSKYAEPRLVRVLELSDRVYSLGDLQEWLSWQRELIGEPRDPWLAACEALGVKPALDVEEALATMAPGNIHDRQLRVSASLLAANKPEEEIVARLLEATRLAAGEEGRRWNWRKEEVDLRAMVRSGEAKGFRAVADLREERRKRVAGGGDSGGNLHPAEAKQPAAGQIAALALETWGRPVAIVRGEPWAYSGGIWEPVQGELEADLRAHVHKAGRVLGKTSGQHLTGAWRWIVEDLDLWRRGVEWDRVGVIVGENGALEVETGKLLPHSQLHYATRKVGCQIRPEAGCPQWLQFLEQAMPEDTLAVIGTLQEWFGAALVHGKPRELRKGLIVYGPSYTGKTQLANVARALLGGKTCGLRVKLMSERFGMQPLIHASGWVADDAVGQHETMDAEAYKIVVTGESTSIERKHTDAIEICFDLPVLLTMNNFPVVRDSSDAVYNRTLALLMRVVRSESDARPIAEIIIASELSGVLNWAVAGYHRLLARGRFDPPVAMQAALREFKGSNNPLPEFVGQCCEFDPDRMILREDFRAAFNEWLEREVQARNGWSGQRIAAAMKNGFPKVIGDKVHDGRVWIGLKFTQEALIYLDIDRMMAKRTLADLNRGLPKELRDRYVKKPRVVFPPPEDE
jgi:P4 family phage/plasmid primase-like protien